MERNERDGGVIKHTITLAILATVAALTLAGCHEPTPDKTPPNAIDVRLVAPHLCEGHGKISKSEFYWDESLIVAAHGMWAVTCSDGWKFVTPVKRAAER